MEGNLLNFRRIRRPDCVTASDVADTQTVVAPMRRRRHFIDTWHLMRASARGFVIT
jgi:hypothetical protein